ncbi:MAG: hypothetical protein KF775_07950 [Cyclobacteriaceae bacterium]|nr:hypothetical protein [Cyclobacteriaceae bacterium]
MRQRSNNIIIAATYGKRSAVHCAFAWLRLGILCVVAGACQTRTQEVVVLPQEEISVDLSHLGKPKLSDYGFFENELKNLRPVAGVLPYSLNAPLFSDYAFKKRFVKIPEGKKVVFDANDVFSFPDGTVLIKNFYYPADFTNPDQRIRILETRLLLNEAGVWKALPYIWNEEQTDAFLNVAGKTISVQWKHTDGQVRNINYSVPNMNQCKGCHLRGDKVMPIGPSARQLNGNFSFEDGEKNQLRYWQAAGLIDLPAFNSIEKLVAYDDETASISNRARAWLEINCAHCHRADGPAKNSGLHLLASEQDPVRLGIGKAPVAAGKGSGGLLYDIVPGKPDQSILQYRIESVHPGSMMPELGRSITHTEGVALVRQWIAELK